MSVFFDIPKVTQIDIVSSWLRPDHLRNLDCAILSHKYRQELLEVFKSPGCILDYVEFCNSWIRNWIFLREVKVKCLSLNIQDLEDKKMRKTLLKNLGPTLQELELMCRLYSEDSEDEEEDAPVACLHTGRAIHDCVRFCPALEGVRVVNGHIDSHFATLIESNFKLKRICLDTCINVGSKVLDAACRSTVLETVTFESCDFCPEAFQFDMPAPGSNHTCTTLTLTGAPSDRLVRFTNIFGSVRTLQVEVFLGDQLATIASHCKLVTTACISINGSALTLSTARAVATSWQHIENLQIIPADKETYVLERGVAVVFVDRCKSLQRLVLACIDDTRFATKSYSPAANGAVSRLRELSVSDLGEADLVYILNKCKELHTLSLHNGIAVSHDQHATPAEYALQHLRHSSVRELHLVNVCLSRAHLQQLHYTSLHTLVLEAIGTHDQAADLDCMAIVELVRNLPHLHTLSIRDSSDTISHLVALAVLPVARKLRHFEYYAAHKTPFCVGMSPMADLLALAVSQQYPQLHQFDVQC